MKLASQLLESVVPSRQLMNDVDDDAFSGKRSLPMQFTIAEGRNLRAILEMIAHPPTRNDESARKERRESHYARLYKDATYEGDLMRESLQFCLGHMRPPNPMYDDSAYAEKWRQAKALADAPFSPSVSANDESERESYIDEQGRHTSRAVERELPPLPEPAGYVTRQHKDGVLVQNGGVIVSTAFVVNEQEKVGPLFTADQMRAYVLADRAARTAPSAESEREAFEAWAKTEWEFDSMFRRTTHGQYADSDIQAAWEGWSARAALKGGA